MLWTTKGAVGIVTAGGMRAKDEVIKQKIHVYKDSSNHRRGIRPGKKEFESYNEPVIIGNTLINSVDVIIADSDAVIVVPREKALEVATGAREELNLDKVARRKLFDELEIPLDFTAK